jgi:colicin import membrane protein
MIRSHEKEIAIQAGALTFLVHAVLFGLMLFSVHWKTVQPMNVAEVELWDTLPTPKVTAQSPKPIQAEEIKPSESAKPTPQHDAPAVLEADIKVKKVLEKPSSPLDKSKAPDKIEKPMEESKPNTTKPTKADLDALKKLQQEMLAEDNKLTPVKSAGPAVVKTDAQSQAGAANQSEVAKYVGLITNKIKQHVNKQVCGRGNPELVLNISLIPTGEVIGHPKLLKSSGLPACDDAVERAILESQPLPVPSQLEVFSQFRELKLKFRPNQDE